MALAAPPSAPAIEIAFPALACYAAGNTGIPYAWTFAARRPGAHVLVQALTHGNEVCGAIALDWLLRQNVRPRCGTLSLVFANIAAYERFDASDPFASRCVDEDFNRLWSAAVLDGPRDSAELRRARQLRALYERVDYLLDLHSMSEACPPLAMAGSQRKGLALAQALGVWAVWLAVRGRGTWTAALAGVAFGLAILANYLAAFIAVGCGVWLLAARNLRVVSFATGLAMLLPVQVWFFLAQRGSRAGQFAPLEWHSALLRLLRFQGAALFGGLPLYAGAWGVAVTVGLGVLAVGAAACAFRRLRLPARALLALLAVCPAAGLLAMAVLSGSTPIELRYLAFGTPFAALLLADALPRPLLAAMLAVQAASIAELALRPETMQPQAEAAAEAAEADALVLLPRGNDGVGIPAAFLQSAAPAMRVRIVGPDMAPWVIRAEAANESRVAAALLPLDADSRTTVPALLAAFEDRCWQPVSRSNVLAVWQHVCAVD